MITETVFIESEWDDECEDCRCPMRVAKAEFEGGFWDTIEMLGGEEWRHVARCVTCEHDILCDDCFDKHYRGHAASGRGRR